MMAPEIDGIVRDVYPALQSRALGLTRNPDRAQDLVQSTLERLLARPPRFAARKLLPWLMVVMNHLFIDQTRALASRWVPLPPDVLGRDPLRDESEPEPMWPRFQPEQLQSALRALPAILRRPYEMHALGRIPYRVIAALLNVEVATVGTRIHRARKHLRATLLASLPGQSALADDLRAPIGAGANVCGQEARRASLRP